MASRFVIRHSSFVIRRQRRATALIFVLGVLTLLALVGLILIARTHGEFQRISNQAVSTSYQSALDGIVRGIQETLRRDIWGNDPNPQLPFQITAPVGDVAEVNEAWDSPGADDRWLASLAPYDAGTSPGMGAVNSFPPPIGDPTNLVGEPNVLAWPFVSYPGTDILAPIHSKDQTGNIGVQPYVWPYNSRENPQPAAPAPASCRLYTAANLQNVPMLQTPPPFPPAGARPYLIPGSTTNVTIADARRDWNTKMSQAPYSNAVALSINAAAGSPKAPLFPYFDTNADGIVDLYDADGDGIPDSPLSFVIPGDSGDPNKPRNLYAAVRIVDHAGMINVNVASSLRKAEATPNASDMSFSESPRQNLQRRGQRTSELLLDDVVNALDRDYDTAADRCRGLMAARSLNGPDPDTYDLSTVKSKLIGGYDLGATTSLLFGQPDEASLRHRGVLVPFDRRFDTGSDYTNIDRSLFNTLLWSRGPAGYGARWSRLDSNYLNGAGYEGYDNAGGKGWRITMSEDEPAALRRQFFTTTSYDVSPAPDIIRRPLNANETADQAIDLSLQQLWALRMDWPVLISANSPLASDPNRPSNAFSDKFIIPAATPMPPPAFRVQQFDLNMGDTNTTAVKDSFIRYAAAAMYLSLQGVGSYQGIDLTSNPLNRQYLAWQFAANLADYRDSDDEPTVIQWPFASAHFVYGVEKQPFMTEAYAYVTAGNDAATDQWWFAIELFVPPYWNIDPARLSLRTSSGDFPLLSFQRVLGGGPPVLNGGQRGQYVVFCGSLNVPTPFATFGQPYFAAHQQFYQYNPALNPTGPADFLLAQDGTGKCELVYRAPTSPNPPDHVIDVIGPQQSGPPVDSYASGISNIHKWAQVIHCPNCPPGGPPSTPDCVCASDKWEYSLLRSTNGWRFSTAWQTYHETKHSLLSGSTAPVQQSLGLPNEPTMPDIVSNHTYELGQNIPESVWPVRAPVVASGGNWVASTPTGTGFEPAGAFSSFDTAGDLGKMLMVGPLTQSTNPPPTIVQKNATGAANSIDAPATLLLAWILQYGTSSNDLPPAPRDRLAAGHPNFAPDRCAPASAYNMKWLLSYCTTQSPLFDGVDNDGNGLVDMADPLEGYAVLNRVAGRLNVNTAPATVLRSVPYMSLLPTSAEYMFHVMTNDGTNPVPPGYSPIAQFGLSAPRPFWDIATGIVATRESRRVNLRLQDPAITLNPPNVNTQMTTVAVGGVPTSAGLCLSAGGLTPLKGALTSIGDLMRVNDRRDLSATNDPDLFNIDRFTRNPNLIHVVNHNYVPTGDPFLGPDNTATPYIRLDSDLSPDFRFRRTSATEGFIEHSPIYDRTNLPIPETSGIRARDVLLSRWANVLTTRSDVFTAYIALIDEDGHYVERSQVTLDRSPCFRERPAPIDPTGRPTQPRDMILPQILSRLDTSYTDDTK